VNSECRARNDEVGRRKNKAQEFDVQSRQSGWVDRLRPSTLVVRHSEFSIPGSSPIVQRAGGRRSAKEHLDRPGPEGRKEIARSVRAGGRSVWTDVGPEDRKEERSPPTGPPGLGAAF
jgi:hypothetical protein